VLPRLFRGQITQARITPIDCGFDEIGRKEASDIIILTLRTLHPARLAMPSVVYFSVLSQVRCRWFETDKCRPTPKNRLLPKCNS